MCKAFPLFVIAFCFCPYGTNGGRIAPMSSTQPESHPTESAEALVHDGVFTVPQALEFAGLKRASLYKLMAEGVLRFVRHGNRRLIPRRELRRLLAERLQGGKRS
jgi:excisionase family DNA binding protein